MARARDPNRDKAFEIYKQHDGNITNRAIAELLNVPEKTIGSWKSKSKDNWDAKLNGVLQSDERSTPKETAKKERGAPVGNTNAKGNKGNKNASPPKRNSNALTHGFYSRVIPEELQELFNEIEEHINTTDMLWDQIRLQYMAIMRAQSIMFVSSKDEMIKELKKAKYDFIQTGEGDNKKVERVAIEEEYNFQFAWERHAQFLNAQSRAIGELRATIEQFEMLADKTDERRLKLEQMQLSIEKTKVEINKLSGVSGGTQESEIAKMLRGLAGES